MKKAFIQLHIAVFLAGFTAVLGRLINLNEGLLVWYRLLITVLALAGYMWYTKELKILPLKAILQMIGVGVIITFHWVTFYGSIKYGNISVALVCLSSAGFFSALIEPLLLKKKIVVAELGLGVLAIIGIYIIFDFHPQYKVGIIYGLLAALSCAIFPILNKQLLLKNTPHTLTLYELFGGFIVLSILLPYYLKQTSSTFVYPSQSDIWYLLILSILCTIICFDLQLQALKVISAFTSNLMFNLEPLYGIFMAFAFFGEGSLFNHQFYIGVLFILAAIVLQMVRLHYEDKSTHKTN